MTSDKRIALVTGGNRGVGYEVVRQLFEQGVHVLLGARDEKRADAAIKSLADDGVQADKLIIDVSDVASIESAAEHITKTYGKLDILINNAAILDDTDGYPTKVSAEVLSKTLNVNFVGVVATTQALLPLLLKSETASIVNVSSPLGSMGVLEDPQNELYGTNFLAYGASKSALNMFTVQLKAELKGKNVAVNSVSPGHCNTNLSNYPGPLTPAKGAEGIVKYALQTSVSGHFYENGVHFPW